MNDTFKRPGLWKRLRAFYFLWRGRVYRHYGIVRGDGLQFVLAVERYERALSLNPLLEAAYLERGAILWRELDRADEAVADLSAALVLRPGWPEALFYRGLAYQAAGNYRAAMQDLTAYLASDDRSWRDHAVYQLDQIQGLLGAEEPAGYDS